MFAMYFSYACLHWKFYLQVVYGGNSLRLFKVGRPIIALYEERVLTTKKFVIVVSMQGLDLADR